jgi:hypothetical protein
MFAEIPKIIDDFLSDIISKEVILVANRGKFLRNIL